MADGSASGIEARLQKLESDHARLMDVLQPEWGDVRHTGELGNPTLLLQQLRKITERLLMDVALHNGWVPGGRRRSDLTIEKLLGILNQNDAIGPLMLAQIRLIQNLGNQAAHPGHPEFDEDNAHQALMALTQILQWYQQHCPAPEPPPPEDDFLRQYEQSQTLEEREASYATAIREALADGTIDEGERARLSQLRADLGIPAERASAIARAEFEALNGPAESQGEGQPRITPGQAAALGLLPGAAFGLVGLPVAGAALVGAAAAAGLGVRAARLRKRAQQDQEDESDES